MPSRRGISKHRVRKVKVSGMGRIQTEASGYQRNCSEAVLEPWAEEWWWDRGFGRKGEVRTEIPVPGEALAALGGQCGSLDSVQSIDKNFPVIKPLTTISVL